MKISYVTVANHNLASFRYSIMLPALELKKLGHEVVIGPNPDSKADVVIFSKHLDYEEYQKLLTTKDRGKKTVFYICDHHFNTKHKEHYERMIRAADVVVANTEQMREAVKEHCSRDAFVVRDPYFYDEAKAEYDPAQRLRVLWFGHQTNIDTIKPLIPWLESFSDLSIVSNMMIDQYLCRPIIPWSVEMVPMELANCDVVIIPSNRENVRKSVKSNNRMIESIRRGRFVISDPLPCYEEFRGMMMVDGIKEGFEWLKEQKREHIITRIQKAQQYIRENYSPKEIGATWERILSN